MASGERYSVPHPDFISVSPRGSYVALIDAKDRPHRLNALLIERASIMNGPSGRRSESAYHVDSGRRIQSRKQ
jgi:hypothetical protein